MKLKLACISTRALCDGVVAFKVAALPHRSLIGGSLEGGVVPRLRQVRLRPWLWR
jgi:hypothetical protein